MKLITNNRFTKFFLKLLANKYYHTNKINVAFKNKFLQSLLMLLLVSAFHLSCSNDDMIIENDSPIINDISLSYTPMENEIIYLINDYRINKGLPELNVFNIVSYEAASHTDYMIKTGEVSHDNFENRCQNLIRYAGAKSIAENVAYGYSTPQAVVNAWIHSDSHGYNIENASFTDFGISVKSNENGKYYFTNIFIKR